MKTELVAELRDLRAWLVEMHDTSKRARSNDGMNKYWRWMKAVDDAISELSRVP